MPFLLVALSGGTLDFKALNEAIALASESGSILQGSGVITVPREAIALSNVTEKLIAALIERADPEHILIIRCPAAEDTVCIEDVISCKLGLTHVCVASQTH
jgi:hypothetical protein